MVAHIPNDPVEREWGLPSFPLNVQGPDMTSSASQGLDLSTYKGSNPRPSVQSR